MAPLEISYERRKIIYDLFGTEMYALRRPSTITSTNRERTPGKILHNLILVREWEFALPKESFIYFIAGFAREGGGSLTDTDRYDISSNTWNKIVDLQEARSGTRGAVAYGKIFIAGDTQSDNQNCEVYDETTNEWQFVASLSHVERPTHSILSLWVFV